MKWLLILSSLISSDAVAADITCMFPEKDLTVAVSNYKVAHSENESVTYNVRWGAKTSSSASKAFPSVSRQANVKGLADNRTSTLSDIDFEGQTLRLIVYHCSGSQPDSVDSRIVVSKEPLKPHLPKIEGEAVAGICTGKDLTKSVTSSCAAFK